eukprot:m.22684 g.22684  ORF g.22684 m.22684 type:complete len:133 (+) comp8881_c0_seq2:106-504(+)
MRQKNKVLAAIEYLILWKTDKKNWKFKKSLQMFTLHNMYNPYMFDHTAFMLVLDYLSQMKGKGKVATVERARQFYEGEGDQSDIEEDALIMYCKYAGNIEVEEVEENMKEEFKTMIAKVVKKRANQILHAVA